MDMEHDDTITKDDVIPVNPSGEVTNAISSLSDPMSDNTTQTLPHQDTDPIQLNSESSIQAIDVDSAGQPDALIGKSMDGIIKANETQSVDLKSLVDEADDNEVTIAVQNSTNTREFIEAAAPSTEESAEYCFDSSDDSSDSTSSDDSDESDDDSDEDYPLLDPATAAKILMAGDGDDDEGGDKKGKTGGEHQLRTANEVKEDVIPRPDIEITPEMQITALGKIEGIVENAMLIKGYTSGEYQVLEPGSILCTNERKVVGVVADLFGRVQQPMYSVLFSTQDEFVQSLQLTTGTELFYVDSHSKFVFTQPLRGLKGTDASNIHDEEVGEDEIEFSDDEKEAEYKRQRKLAKKSGRGGLSRGAFNEGERIDIRAPSSHNYVSSNDAPRAAYDGGLNYDDEGTGDGFYQPLKRPDNLAQMMSGSARGDRGRGRGDRGRGRGDRGRGRGQRSVSSRDAPRQQTQTAPSPTTPYTPQPQQAQNYQFNGYTFQYGVAQPAQPQQYAPYPQYAQQQAPVVQSGAYINPAFYTNYIQQSQQQYSSQQSQQPQQSQYSQQQAQQPQQSQYSQQQPQQYQQPQYSQQQPQQYQQHTPQYITAPDGQTAYNVHPPVQYNAAQQQNLAEVMRRFGPQHPQQ